MTKEQLREESLIDLAFEIFQSRREPITLPHLMDEIRKLTGITKKEMETRMPQFYTDLNIDGRFMAMNEGNWSLREWYPVDQIEEETAPVVKTRKKKKKSVDDDDEEDEDLDDLDVEVFEEDYEELGDEKEVADDEEDDDEDEDEDVDDPAEGLEIIPEDELGIDEEDDEEDEEEDEEEL